MIFHISFDHEFDELLHVTGWRADRWLLVIRWFGPLLVLVWVFLTRAAVPSDKGLIVWGKRTPEGRRCVFRLGEMAMLYRYDWRSVHVIWLQSSRQKAWLHGVSFPTVSVTPDTQDDAGQAVD